jgi:hypothetical protein
MKEINKLASEELRKTGTLLRGEVRQNSVSGETARQRTNQKKI